MDNHEEIQARMGDAREQESINLAIKLLYKSIGEKYVVLVPAVKPKSGTKEEALANSDDGDIWLVNLQEVESVKAIKIVEVKRLSDDNVMAHFETRESWKLPNFIVDGVIQLKRKKHFPYAYMCFNAKLTAYAVIYGHTYNYWEKQKTNGNGGIKEYYVVDPDKIKFVKIDGI